MRASPDTGKPLEKIFPKDIKVKYMRCSRAMTATATPRALFSVIFMQGFNKELSNSAAHTLHNNLTKQAIYSHHTNDAHTHTHQADILLPHVHVATIPQHSRAAAPSPPWF